jgi:hypothetical protein
MASKRIHDGCRVFPAIGNRVAAISVELDDFPMPAKSKKQQMAAGAALAAKRGKKSKQALKGASRGMAQSMSEAELRKLAKTKRKKLPTRKHS